MCTSLQCQASASVTEQKPDFDTDKLYQTLTKRMLQELYKHRVKGKMSAKGSIQNTKLREVMCRMTTDEDIVCKGRKEEDRVRRSDGQIN